MLLILAVSCLVAVRASETNLRGSANASQNATEVFLAGSFSLENATVSNVTALGDSSDNPLAGVMESIWSFGTSTGLLDAVNLTLASSGSSGGCLCIFDIDRTLTGKQGAVSQCQGNKVLHGVYDIAYGGGDLTLSDVGQHLGSTFCGSCHVGAISADPHHRPHLPVSRVVVGCDAGCKAQQAARMAQSLGVAKHEVYMFDDKANNINSFHGSGMNAQQVSCGSREGSHGLCGAKTSEIQKSFGVKSCR
mmetsp:Transcript_47698/g.85876  ORF Transcript_47698/g.85876 Transcript_47698/m.85876 type:complete len:249 (+) Transcript_47698:123-869(+)|eukprot:CAMPEP_0197647546 /NCGR_PEP_ID=MMETSP1338-20131121/25744_1 /TAXON_ID=43686 ORGANISM="Pelagodinium beii, Strain RCC1491" /NCGR_SAMPLE_ID=MMETSP1338 /ASSEMBLY_ACC=CAM_ASM_000754 /LENGTH=248 /DNA_ID=CAMNT_0043221373 /DNA_START=122 /DNA_END=868 /DNA_ORIENTATION=-